VAVATSGAPSRAPPTPERRFRIDRSRNTCVGSRPSDHGRRITARYWRPQIVNGA